MFLGQAIVKERSSVESALLARLGDPGVELVGEASGPQMGLEM
jgi:hypothetical protein